MSSEMFQTFPHRVHMQRATLTHTQAWLLTVICHLPASSLHSGELAA